MAVVCQTWLVVQRSPSCETRISRVPKSKLVPINTLRSLTVRHRFRLNFFQRLSPVVFHSIRAFAERFIPFAGNALGARLTWAAAWKPAQVSRTMLASQA